ncbi:helix-turn-helix domain-containing protein [Streptomyces sp. NBC_00190]|uniref:PucR family transcriptional regulator n=1 Tax=unclassified Streptomyces TaxID=2593676 RepID=UPI002E2A22BF|nr:helix-turn-helix domain-containing protein [Streptomyces sp. NBC_00190]WSZ43650.1 helix-turn-helix domain-containing protein [Streptomyces sp. NBC_00868]
MCELLNRIWSRPRGEWTRVLRRELPALAAEIVEELLHGIPGFSTLTDDNDAIDDELLRQCVEEALLSALGYRDARSGNLCKEQEQHRQQVMDMEPEPDESVCADEVQHERAGELRVEARQHGGQQDAGRHDEKQGGHHDEPQGGHHTGHHGGLPGLPRQPGRRGGDRARQDLFKALTDDRAPSESSLTELAEAANWPLPVAVRAIVPATPGEAQQLATVLDDALVGMFAGRPCLLVPSPDPDTRAPLELSLRGRFTAVGHAVPLRDTASSLRWALRLLALTPTRAGLDARAIFVDDHLSTLLLLQDEPLAHALAARWLRPLADLTPRQSERLEVTLLAWLEGGGAPEAAKALSVHPQTVRYRMRQLEKLFGPGLRDPRTRFELEMALRSRRLMAQVRRQASRVGRRTARVVTADFRPVVVGRMARVNGL